MKSIKLRVKMQIINMSVYGFFENCGIVFSHVCLPQNPELTYAWPISGIFSKLCKHKIVKTLIKKQYFATSGTFRFGAETTYGLSAEVYNIKKSKTPKIQVFISTDSIALF